MRYIFVGDVVRMNEIVITMVTPFFFSDGVRLDLAAANIAAPLIIIDTEGVRSCYNRVE